MANPKPGSFVHIQLASTDPARTRKFFEDVFAWTFEDIPEMDYATFEAPSGPGGGLTAPMEGQPPGILSYLLSSDVDADLRRIEGAGGRVLRPKTEIPGIGWWALFEEPTGIVLALFQARPDMSRPERKERARRRSHRPRGSTRPRR